MLVPPAVHPHGRIGPLLLAAFADHWIVWLLPIAQGLGRISFLLPQGVALWTTPLGLIISRASPGGRRAVSGRGVQAH